MHLGGKLVADADLDRLKENRPVAFHLDSNLIVVLQTERLGVLGAHVNVSVGPDQPLLLVEYAGRPDDEPGPLIVMLGDTQADVRYNAATALARYGREEAVDTLNRMLLADISRPDILQEDDEKRRELKTSTLLISALAAIKVLASTNRDADLRPLRENLEQLAETGSEAVRVRAAEALQIVQRRGPGSG